MAEKIFCILGKPAKHSLSPIMQSAGFKAIGLDGVYLAFEPKSLAKAVSCLREFGVSGFNVTMPFKEKIIPLLDEVDSFAKKTGAVNTVVNKNGKLKGYNTDGIGAVNALKKKTKIRGKKLLLLGAGGAAKAIAFALAKEGAFVTVASRKKSIAKARGLAKRISGKAICIEEIYSLGKFDVLVNATSVGMKPKQNAVPIPAGLLRKNLVVFDIVYNPLETRLLKEAKKRKCKTVAGIEMLLEQGFAGFELFTGKKAPEREMRKAVMREIGG